MGSKKIHPEIQLLLRLLDEAYEKQAWHGPNLRGSLRGLTFRDAAPRPARGRHNIWELTVHAAYWKYVVRRRLTGERRGSFPLKGSNWFERPIQSTSLAWKKDLKLLDEQHRLLRAVIEKLPPERLYQKSAGSSQPNIAIVQGIAAHDFYHAGQIQLIKRLTRTGP